MTDRIKSDFAAHYALAVITDTEDKVQMRRVGDRLYAFDYSEAFCLDEFQMKALELSEDVGEKLLERAYISFIERELIFDLPDTARKYHILPERMTKDMVRYAKRILSITEDDIKAMEDELDQIYPVSVGVYYELCIKAMQEKISKYV